MQIRSGDTLSGIAQQQGTSVEALMRLNPQLQDPDVIQAGESLRLPGQRDAFQQQGAPAAAPGLSGAPGGALPGGGGAPGAGAAPSAVEGLPTGIGAPEATSGGGSTESLELARSLIGRSYGDPAGASAEPVGADSPFMHCAQFVNAVYPDLPASAPQMAGMADPNREPQPGDVITSNQPAPWGHVGIMTEQGTVIHSIPGRGVHESSLAEFETYSPVTGVIAR